MEDYYAVVGLDRTASAEEIDRKIREQLRIWQRRTTNADLSRRQEAERRVQLLGEARATLVDAAKRRRYDQQLAAGSVPTPEASPASPRGATGWLERARQQLADNDYQAAAYAARQARDAPGAPAQVWGVLARASAGLGRLDDALFEARHGVTLDPESAQAHLDLAHVYEQRGDWTQAFEAFETANRLDPRAEAATTGMKRSLASSARPAEAVDRLERRYARADTSERAMVGRLLGQALVTSAERTVLGRRRGGRAAVGGAPLHTPQQERDALRLLQRAREVTRDPEVLGSVDALERHLVRAPRQFDPAGASGPARRFDTRDAWQAFAPDRATVPRTNRLATASLVCALCGLCLPFSAPVGAVLGHVARRQIRERGELGDGLALGGITIGWIITIMGFCLTLYLLSWT